MRCRAMMGTCGVNNVTCLLYVIKYYDIIIEAEVNVRKVSVICWCRSKGQFLLLNVANGVI